MIFHSVAVFFKRNGSKKDRWNNVKLCIVLVWLKVCIVLHHYLDLFGIYFYWKIQWRNEKSYFNEEWYIHFIWQDKIGHILHFIPNSGQNLNSAFSVNHFCVNFFTSMQIQKNMCNNLEPCMLSNIRLIVSLSMVLSNCLPRYVLTYFH